MIVPLPWLAQKMWLLFTLTPAGRFWPETSVVTPVPSGLALLMVPPKALVQYRWLLSTVSPAGTFWFDTRVCTVVLGRLITLTVPAPESVQYRWTTLVPVSESVAAACWPVAVSVAVTVPRLVGANRTVTMHVMPGPNPSPGQVVAVIVNSADPGSVKVTLPDALPPLLVSVN